MTTTTSIQHSAQGILRLTAAVIGAAVLLGGTLTPSLANEPVVRDQREDRVPFGALNPETVALITSGLTASTNADSDDSDEDEETEGQNPQGLLEKKKPTSSSPDDGVIVESLKLGVVKSGYINRCYDGLNAVSVTVKNSQQKTADGVLVRVFSDGKEDRAAETVITSLNAGDSIELGFDNVYIKKGSHKLTATVRLVPITAPALKAESEPSYSSTKTIRVKCGDKDDQKKDEAKEA